MIAIVDYRMGNLRSVQKGFEHAGVEDVVVTDDPGVVERADGINLASSWYYGGDTTHTITGNALVGNQQGIVLWQGSGSYNSGEISWNTFTGNATSVLMPGLNIVLFTPMPT